MKGIKLYLSKIISMFVSIIMCMNVAIPVAHACSYEENAATIPSKAEIIEELFKIGFTDEEIEELFIRFPYEENIEFFSDSSHPDKTETYIISTRLIMSMGYTIDITAAGLALSSQKWEKIVVECVGWKIVVLASKIGSALATMHMGPTGVELVVTYRWTYGDNSMTWQYIPISYKATKC